MVNKIYLKVNIIVIFLATIINAFCSFAQNNSIASTTAIGQRSINGNPISSALGTQSVSYVFPNSLNTYNPASYSFLNYQYPIFSIGIYSKTSEISENKSSETLSNTTLSDIAFGLSFAKRFGLAFGFKPIYQTKYSFSQITNNLSQTLRYTYEGSGSTNKGYVGFSVKLINKEIFQLSVGSNFGSLFGRTEHLRKSTIVNAINNAGGVDAKVHQIRSFHYDLGAVLRYKLKKEQEITIGTTFEPKQKLNSTYSRSLYFATPNVDNPNDWKTPINTTNELKGNINLPQHLQIGLAYTKNFQTKKKNNGTRQSQLLVLAEYAVDTWSDYKENYADSIFDYNFKNKTLYQIGIQYTPETSYIGNVIPKLFERTNYRLGFYSMLLPYLHNNNTQFSQWAASIGFGFPIMIEQRLDSSLQLSISAGKRNNSDNDALKETFVTVGLGILITPSRSDRWFIKRKLD